jgi:hypothetical protein
MQRTVSDLVVVLAEREFRSTSLPRSSYVEAD